MGPRCMDCGTEFRLTQPHEGRNPWHAVNRGQSQCNACFTLGKGELSSTTVPDNSVLVNLAKDATLSEFADAFKGEVLEAAVAGATIKQPQYLADQAWEAANAVVTMARPDAKLSALTDMVNPLKPQYLADQMWLATTQGLLADASKDPLGNVNAFDKALGTAGKMADFNKALGTAGKMADLNKALGTAGKMADLNKALGTAGK